MERKRMVKYLAVALAVFLAVGFLGFYLIKFKGVVGVKIVVNYADGSSEEFVPNSPTDIFTLTVLFQPTELRVMKQGETREVTGVDFYTYFYSEYSGEITSVSGTVKYKVLLDGTAEKSGSLTVPSTLKNKAETYVGKVSVSASSIEAWAKEKYVSWSTPKDVTLEFEVQVDVTVVMADGSKYGRGGSDTASIGLTLSPQQTMSLTVFRVTARASPLYGGV